MEFNSYKSIKAAETALRKRGYDRYFKLQGTTLVNPKSGEIYTPEDLIMIEHHRFPSKDQWQDTQIIFALEDLAGNRGLVHSTYGMPNYIQLIDFIDKVKIRSTVNS